MIPVRVKNKFSDHPQKIMRPISIRLSEEMIELLESTDPEGPIGKFIEKKGEGIHHIAFAVKGIE